ncbi:TetR/AcrR family transcriptional regulator [Solimonas terrae]|uniref:TetR/AcrR family transcriptional regulator n=1 Tax=Solimonas terrae TaxID=1396819 RepID=A0A6M2BSB1_9GAMM|nr:TetR/AcrR family transcriptional regulator [Solimonas terrae]NGY04993.1 TetR/AcrR family transcriptional regulator [Solimonas terrae]
MGNKIYSPHLSTARDARAIRTREALRAAMLELLESKPLEQISIRDIVAAAGIGYTTFFRHHPTKEALLDELAAEEIRRLVDLTLPVMDAGSEMAASIAVCAYVDERRALWTTLLTGGAAAALREEFLRIAQDLATVRSQPGDWPPVEVATRLLVGGTIELLAWWLRQPEPLPGSEIARIHHDIVILPVLRGRASVGRLAPPAIEVAAKKRGRR